MAGTPTEDATTRKPEPELGVAAERLRDSASAAGGPVAPERVVHRLEEWMAARGLEPYPAQRAAFDAIARDAHVVLDTPTGSGKSLAAVLVHFKALCEGRTSYYTAPTKALVSEKFFALCADFGADRVGMLTGDVSLNRGAPIVCCTAEVLANLVLRGGAESAPDYAVMDEFHYYSDRQRGAAWQVPLIALTDTRFLLMSATLGDVSHIAKRVEARTGRRVAVVQSDVRPVPLDFEYRETPLHETVEALRAEGKLPAYVVSFTQRGCAVRAQALSSLAPTTRQERERIALELEAADFGTPYGRQMQRLLRVGIGIHHAGLLPRYRRMVERLAQAALLKVICGTDTLGVGVNIPIRTVVFAKLAKYDGHRVRLLSVRQFKQIAGRAGRKGFDDLGSVVCQAPEHVIENRRRAERATRRAGRRGGGRGLRGGRAGSRRPGGGGGPGPGRGLERGHRGSTRPRSARQSKPGRDEVTWTRKDFQRLVQRPPEPLVSRFEVTHGMLLSILQGRRDAAAAEALTGPGSGSSPDPTSGHPPGSGSDPGSIAPADRSGGYRDLVRLVLDCHDPPTARPHHLRAAAERFRALRRAGIVEVAPAPGGGSRVLVSEALQLDFSMHQSLSLYLVDAVAALSSGTSDNTLDVLSVVEAILDDPRQVLYAQQRRARAALDRRLAAEGIPPHERRDQLDAVSWPRPLQEFLFTTFDRFARQHPWLRRDDIRPKSIAREMYERGDRFADFVVRYRLEPSEGTLLRYLNEVYRTLRHAVPDEHRPPGLADVETYLRGVLVAADASLLAEWEQLREPA